MSRPRWLMMPREAFGDSRLRGGDLQLLAFYYEKADGRGLSWWGLAKVARALGRSPSWVQKARTRLKSAGYLAVQVVEGRKVVVRVRRYNSRTQPPETPTNGQDGGGPSHERATHPRTNVRPSHERATHPRTNVRPEPTVQEPIREQVGRHVGLADYESPLTPAEAPGLPEGGPPVPGESQLPEEDPGPRLVSLPAYLKAIDEQIGGADGPSS